MSKKDTDTMNSERFIQLHVLTSYPPSNLNRDDLGRPKTAIVGGTTRLRISSQSLKRAWRTSDIFEEALGGHIGTRTKEMGIKIYNRFIEKGTKEKDAIKWSQQIAGVFGKLKSLKKEEKNKLNDKKTDKEIRQKLINTALEIEQLAHISPEEEKGIFALVDILSKGNSAPNKNQLALLEEENTAVDIAMSGRMLTKSDTDQSNVKYCIEAAVQVAHAITVHKVAVEDDFFTAVDDLNDGRDDAGAAHLGEMEFGSGLFYIYVCIDRELLKKNLQINKKADNDLVNRGIRALVTAMTTVSPTGKQNSYASRAYASYLLVEKGNYQPRSLAVAFLKPVFEADILESSIEALNETRDKMNQVYGISDIATESMNAQTGKGSLEDIIIFITGDKS